MKVILDPSMNRVKEEIIRTKSVNIKSFPSVSQADLRNIMDNTNFETFNSLLQVE